MIVSLSPSVCLSAMIFRINVVANAVAICCNYTLLIIISNCCKFIKAVAIKKALYWFGSHLNHEADKCDIKSEMEIVHAAERIKQG